MKPAFEEKDGIFTISPDGERFCKIPACAIGSVTMNTYSPSFSSSCAPRKRGVVLEIFPIYPTKEIFYHEALDCESYIAQRLREIFVRISAYLDNRGDNEH